MCRILNRGMLYWNMKNYEQEDAKRKTARQPRHVETVKETIADVCSRKNTGALHVLAVTVSKVDGERFAKEW